MKRHAGLPEEEEEHKKKDTGFEWMMGKNDQFVRYLTGQYDKMLI